MRYEFHAAARMEHLDHVAYYESRQPGLGGAYLLEFDSAVSKICEAPARSPVVREPKIRRVHLRRFPITILFRQSDGLLQVLALAHKRRRPGYWAARI